MTAALSQLGIVGLMGGTSVLQPGLPGPSRLQSEGHFCLLPSQRVLPTAFCMVLLFLERAWQDTLFSGLG